MSAIKIIIKVNPHSLVDLITNSSTEIFVVNTDKTIQIVQEMIDEIQNKYPNEYDHQLEVYALRACELNEIFDFYEIRKAKRFLEANGYEITKKVDATPYLAIKGERGGLDPRVNNFIHDNFEVVYYDNEF